MSSLHAGVASATPISLSEHGQRGWKRASGYGFARRIALEPLAIGEIPRVAQSIPVVFRNHEGCWEPVAVLGPVLGANVFVDTDGQWRGGFVPGGLRVYPFCLRPDSGELGLWPGYATFPVGNEGVLSFYSGDELTPELQSVLGFLVRRSEEIAKAREVLTWLAARDVLVPWQMSGVDRPDDSRALAGLYRVDVEQLHRLEDTSLLGLLRAGHLPWVYAHLASLEHVERFKLLAKDLVKPDVHGPKKSKSSHKAAGILAAMAEDLGDAEL